MTAQSRRDLSGLVALLMLMTWLAARMLTADLPFVDEYWSVYKSGGAPYGPVAPSEILRRIVEVDPGGMGALYYVALAAWESVVGATPETVVTVARAYSLLLGTLAVACTYRVGRLLFPANRAGLYAAALLATSAFFVDYLHEARAYTQVVLLACAVAWAYWALLTAPRPKFWRYLALTAALAALAYSHYVALALAGVIGVYHLARWSVARDLPRDGRAPRITLAVLAAGVIYAPWLPVLLEVARRGAGDLNRQATSLTAATAIETLLIAFANGGGAGLALLLGGLALWRLMRPPASRADRPAAALVWAWAVGGLALALAVNAVVPFLVHLRYLIYLWPALALIGGLGIAALARRGLSPAYPLAAWIAVALWASLNPAFIAGLFGHIDRAPRAGVDAALHLLDSQAQPSDLVLFHIAQPGTEPFQLFVLDFLMRDRGVSGRYDQVERINNSFARDEAGYAADIAATLAAPERIWTLIVPDVPTTGRSAIAFSMLGATHTPCGLALDRPDAQLTLHTRRPDDPRAAREAMPLGFVTPEGAMVRAAVLDGPRPSGFAHMPVVLAWNAPPRVNPAAYSTALHLEDAAGQLVRQVDGPLPAGAYRCQYAALPIGGLPAGDYALYALVYDWATGARLPLETGGDRAPLGMVTLPPAD